MSKFNFSYSTIEDVYAVSEQEGKPEIIEFGLELERAGIATFDGVEYMYRNTPYGMEIVSTEDYASETEYED